MSGNATEEGLLGQIGNPSHGDPLRVVALASFVAGGAVYLLARWAIPVLSVWGGIVIGLAVCLSVAWALSRWFRARALDRSAREASQRREAQEAETEARIAAMQPGPEARS